MKKAISLLCLVILILALSACSKEDNVIKAIEQIGQLRCHLLKRSKMRKISTKNLRSLKEPMSPIMVFWKLPKRNISVRQV